MAFVHIIIADNTDILPQPIIGGVKSGYEQTILVGNPAQVSKITSVPSSFAAAGSPDMRLTGQYKLGVINTDTSIEIAVVRRGHAPSEVVPVPIAVPSGGMTSYVFKLPPAGSDIFVRTLA